MTIASKEAAPAFRLLGARDVCRLTSFSRSSLYQMTKRGEFPKPLQVGARRVAWLESDVKSWLERCVPVSWAA